MNCTFTEYVDFFNNYFKEVLKIDSIHISLIIIGYCKEPFLVESQINKQLSEERVASIIQLKNGNLALGTFDGNIQIWDSNKEKILLEVYGTKQNPNGAYDRVTSLCECTDNVIASGSSNNTTLIITNFNTMETRNLPFVFQNSRGISCLNSTDNELMIGFTGGNVLILNMESNKCNAFKSGPTAVFSILRSDQLLIVAALGTQIFIKNLEENKDSYIDTFTDHGNYYPMFHVRSCTVLPNNLLAVSQCTAKRSCSSESGDVIGIWSLKTLQCVNIINDIPGAINKIVFLIDRFITVVAYSRVFIIDYMTGQQIQKFEYCTGTDKFSGQIVDAFVLDNDKQNINVLTLLDGNRLIVSTVKGVVMFNIK